MRRLRALPRPVVWLLAGLLVLALSGVGATAARKLTGKDIKDRSLTGRDIKRSSLTGKQIRNRSLSAQDFRSSIVGPQGPQGAQGPPGLINSEVVTGDAAVFGQEQAVLATALCSPGKQINSGGYTTPADNVAFFTTVDSGPTLVGGRRGWEVIAVSLDAGPPPFPGAVRAIAVCGDDFSGVSAASQRTATRGLRGMAARRRSLVDEYNARAFPR